LGDRRNRDSNIGRGVGDAGKGKGHGGDDCLRYLHGGGSMWDQGFNSRYIEVEFQWRESWRIQVSIVRKGVGREGLLCLGSVFPPCER
jgi:hypothetical protein